MLKNLPKDFPVEFIEMMRTWDEIVKSPYGHSYYSEPVGWGGKPDKSYRISDHWNFTSKGKVHCATTEECPNNSCWTVAIYNGDLGKYEVIQSIVKSTDEIVLRELSFLEIKRERGLKYIRECSQSEYSFEKRCKQLELQILNSYFKILQRLYVPGKINEKIFGN